MATTSPPPTTGSRADLVRWTFETLNNHDPAQLKQLLAPDAVERFPDRTCPDAEAIVTYFEEVMRAIPDFHMEIEAIAEQGDDVFVRWRLTGTHEGEMMGIEPTHKRVEVDGIDHFVVREGKIVSNFVVFDQLQYARQIGMMPPDGSSADKALKGAFNAGNKLMARLKR